MIRQEADKIWEKHKEQFPEYSVMPKDTSTFWHFLSSLVSEDEEGDYCSHCGYPFPLPLHTEWCKKRQQED